MTAHTRRQFFRLSATALVIAIAFSPTIWPGRARAQAGTATDYKALAQTLRAGGLNILVRHGATNSNETDAVPFDFGDIGKQRNLNEKGKQQARAFGEAVRKAGIPVGEVHTSQFNRAYETATLAGFTHIEKTSDLTSGAPTATAEEKDRHAKALLAMLGRRPAKGTNVILVTHHPNIVDALGKDWSDVAEGEASIFKPDDGKYKLIARVKIEDWPSIAAAK